MRSEELKNEWAFFFWSCFRSRSAQTVPRWLTVFVWSISNAAFTLTDCHKALLNRFRHKKSLSSLPCCNLQIRNSHRREGRPVLFQDRIILMKCTIFYFYLQSLYVGFDTAKSFLRPDYRPLRYSVLNMFWHDIKIQPCMSCMLRVYYTINLSQFLLNPTSSVKFETFAKQIFQSSTWISKLKSYQSSYYRVK